MPPEVIHFINNYSYLAIFILIFLQEIGAPIPLPNELVMLFSGYLAFKGTLSLTLILLVIISADFSGTMLLYIVFYFFGKYIVSRNYKLMPLSAKTINKLSNRINKGGLWTVFLCRLTPFIRGYTSVISGLLRLKPKLFIPICLLSSVIVCSSYIIIGNIFGASWNLIAKNFSAGNYIILGILLAIIATFISKKIIANKKEKQKNTAYIKYMTEQKITVNVVSETSFVAKGQGVHTAFLEMSELLREDKNINVVINGKGDFDIFHSHTYGPYYFLKGRKYKGRRILTVHVIPDSIKGSIPFWKYMLPLANFYFRKVYSFADVVIAISPTVEKTIKDLGVKSKIVKIYNPVMLDNWKRTDENRIKGRKILGLKDDEIMVLGVGQLQERKGVEDFIDIGEAIPNAKFVWAGGRPFGFFTEGINRINTKIANAKSNLQFAGLFDLNDMPAIYAAADIFLFPSNQENCPLAPLEAAAAGLPVVFRDIKEYESLYEFPYLKAKKNEEFIRLTNQLINDNVFYDDAVAMSQKLITEFDKTKIRNQLTDLYKDLLNNYFSNN